MTYVPLTAPARLDLADVSRLAQAAFERHPLTPSATLVRNAALLATEINAFLASNAQPDNMVYNGASEANNVIPVDFDPDRPDGA